MRPGSSVARRISSAAVASASGRARWVGSAVRSKKRASSASLYDVEVGIGLARQHQRVEVATRLDARAVGERGVQEAEVEAHVVADEQRVAGPVEELARPPSAASGAPGHVRVGDAVELGADDGPRAA